MFTNQNANQMKILMSMHWSKTPIWNMKEATVQNIFAEKRVHQEITINCNNCNFLKRSVAKKECKYY